jgi:hypothetical protein
MLVIGDDISFPMMVYTVEYHEYTEMQMNVNFCTTDLFNKFPYNFHTKTLTQHLSTSMNRSTSVGSAARGK